MDRRSAAQEGVVTLQTSVKQLHFGSMEEKEIAAKQVMRFASNDLKTRKSLAALGVIPSLVSMLDSHLSHRRRLAVRALIELANGTYTNKALMVEAGILSKFSKNVETVDDDNDDLIKNDFAVLLLSITSSANIQFPIFSMEFLPFIMGVLDSKAGVKTKIACLGTLHNLSTMLDNVGILISSGVVIPTLLRLSSNKETSEKALATLGNLVVSVMGKKEIENDPLVPESLIEIMTWDEKPRCQELAVYILMILAHRSCEQRKKMRQFGIVPVLLEVGLLGRSPIAQKRALKMLEWFKDDEKDQTKIMGCDVKEKKMMMNEEKRMIRELVKQSLAKNMKVMTNRVSNCC